MAEAGGAGAPAAEVAAEDATTGVCPVCMESFPADVIARHALECLDLQLVQDMLAAEAANPAPLPEVQPARELIREADMIPGITYIDEIDRRVADAADRVAWRRPPRRRHPSVDGLRPDVVEGVGAPPATGPETVSGALCVHVHEARNVSAGLVAPSLTCKVTYEGDSKQTPTCRFSRNPEWDFSVAYEVPEFYGPSPVVIEVFNKPLLPPGSRLGTVTIPLKSIVRKQHALAAKLPPTPPTTKSSVATVAARLRSEARSFVMANQVAQPPTPARPRRHRMRRRGAPPAPTPTARPVPPLGADRMGSPQNPYPETATPPLSASAVAGVTPPGAHDADPLLVTEWLPIEGCPGAELRVSVRFVDSVDVDKPVGALHRTPILWAATHGQTDFLTLLKQNLRASSVARGADGLGVADLAALGGTDAHHACLLTVPGADEYTASAPPVRGRTTLHQAVLGGHMTIVRLVMARAPQLLPQTDAAGLSPFALACSLGRDAIAKVLVGERETALAAARDRGVGRVVHGRWILGPSSTLASKTLSGDTALTLAARGAHVEVIKYLLQLELPVHSRTGNGSTALHLVAACTSAAPGAVTTTCQLLLAGGLQPSENNAGRRPHHVAAAAGNVVALRALTGLGGHLSAAALMAKDGTGRTAWDLARDSCPGALREEALGVLNAAAAGLGADVPAPQTPYSDVSCEEDAAADGDGWASDDSYVYESEGDAGPQAVPYGESKDDGVEAESKTAPTPLVDVSSLKWACDKCTLEQPLARFNARCIACGNESTAYVDACTALVSGSGEGGPTPHVAPPMLPPPPAAPGLARQHSHEVLEPESLAEEHIRLLKETATALDVPTTVAGLLLHAFKWDTSALVMKYMEDPRACLSSAGVSHDIAHPEASSVIVYAGGEDEEVLCDACYDDVPSTDVMGMHCGHMFCSSCWANHLQAAVESGPRCITDTACLAAPDCKQIVDELTWEMLAPAEAFKKYHRFLIRSYVDMDPSMVMCPNPKGCGRVVRYRGDRPDLTCVCGYSFCFKCGMEQHAPCSCDEYLRWKDVSNSLSEVPSVQLMMKNFKRCPKCKVFIEKNAGKANWTGYSHRCDGYSELSQMQPSSWNDAEDEEVKTALERPTEHAVDMKTFQTTFTRYGTQNLAQDQVASRLKALGQPLPNEAGGGRPKDWKPPIIERCETLWRLHAQPGPGFAQGQLAAMAVSHNLCALNAGTADGLQPMFHCRTCQFALSVTLCLPCALRCHAGHSVVFVGFKEGQCGCYTKLGFGGDTGCKGFPLGFLEVEEPPPMATGAGVSSSGALKPVEPEVPDPVLRHPQLPVLVDALLQLHTFHNVLKNIYIRLFFSKQKGGNMLVYKASLLERSVEYLFALTDLKGVDFEAMDFADMKSFADATAKFVRGVVTSDGDAPADSVVGA